MALFGKKKQKDPNQATPGDEAPIDDEFPALARQAAADPHANGALWKRTLLLDEWHFIPRVPPGKTAEQMMADGESIGPLVATVKGSTNFMAFTSVERAVRCAKANGLGKVADKGTFATLSMSVEGAVKSLCGNQDPRISGIMFNSNKGEQAFYGNFDFITAMLEMHRDLLPIELFDRFVRVVAQSNTQFAWNRLQRRVALQDEWFYFPDPEIDERPVIWRHEDRDIVLMYTDEERLEKGSRMLENEPGPWSGSGFIPRRALATKLAIPTTQAAVFSPDAEVIINMGGAAFTLTLPVFSHLIDSRDE